MINEILAFKNSNSLLAITSTETVLTNFLFGLERFWTSSKVADKERPCTSPHKVCDRRTKQLLMYHEQLWPIWLTFELTHLQNHKSCMVCCSLHVFSNHRRVPCVKKYNKQVTKNHDTSYLVHDWKMFNMQDHFLLKLHSDLMRT